MAGTVAATTLPGIAQAADGENVVVGQVKEGTNETGVKLADESLMGMFLANSVHPDPTVTNRVGVFGFTNQPGEMSAGVLGRADHDEASGVWGVNFYGGDGVRGYSRSGTGAGVSGSTEGEGPGVWGSGGYTTKSDPLPGTGVQGEGIKAGVAGFSGVLPNSNLDGTGVRGVGSNIGVQAESDGRALNVQGKAYFSSSGSDFIPAGSASKVVSGVALDENALVLATLQESAGRDICVHYAKKISDTSFEVVLNKSTRNGARFAWFIIN